MTNPDLKPCPFCGSEDVTIDWNSHNTSGLEVRCDDCGMCCSTAPNNTESELLTAWNKRASE